MGFLDGLKVVDATRLLPGGYCTMLLSDMGAEVIKVEQPGLGDYMRATPPTRGGVSPAHLIINRNKLSIGIDLKSPAGKRVMRRLVKEAHVFIEGFRPGVAKRLGFSFDHVRKINPRVVYCSISAYGQKNPLSSMPGHDINFQAMGGTLGYSKNPLVPQIQLGDMVSGMYAAVTILGALSGRRGAVYLDVPIVRSLLSWMVIPVASFLATGNAPVHASSLIFGSTPYYTLYRTSDGKFMAVAAIEEEFWVNLVRELGVPGMAGKRFGSARERKEVEKTLKRVFASRTRDHWSSRPMFKNTCATPVLGLDEALQSNWAKTTPVLADPGTGAVLTSPVSSMPASKSGRLTPAPSLGQHTGVVMRRLGYSEEETKRLIRRGALQ